MKILFNMVSIATRKVVSDMFSDPEKVFKGIFLTILMPILLFLLVFIVPIVIIFNLPTILLDGRHDAQLTAKQLEVAALYQQAPVTVNKNNLEWIEKKKRDFSACDDIVVSYNFNLTWQHLMAIDSVLLGQDFNKTDNSDVIKLGERFMIKEAHIETYQVKVEYTVRVKEPDGTISKERRTRTETKQRGIINVSTKSLDSMLNELGLSSLEKDTIQNIYKTINGFDTEGNLNPNDDVGLGDFEPTPGSVNLPYFNQGDSRWAYLSYGGSTIKSGGCGPTSLSMVVAGLTGQNVNPKIVADWSVANGHRVEGSGSAWSLMTAGGAYYGLKVKTVCRKDPQGIIEALSKGYPVIASMGRGHFTQGGHFIVLRGITKDGKILVNDPASVARTQQSWDLSIIMNESSTNGGVNGYPFWVFSR